jgi:putative transposase
VLYKELRPCLGAVFRSLTEQKECRVEDGHLMPDHVHMLLSAIHLARTNGGRRRNFVGQHFWARGCFLSTVGRDEAAVRAYIKNQEQEDKRLEQLEMFSGS